MRIAAGIVLYNPEINDRFLTCLHSVLDQFDRVYLFDNSTEQYKMIDLPQNTKYITERQNKGIAYALNRIMEAADNDGYEWVVTMDQDSILPEGTVEEYSRSIDEDGIGIICLQAIDSRRVYQVPKTEPTYEYTDRCITSGSCTSIKVWKEIGCFDEWLFIDLVDTEFSKRVIASGYKIKRINTIVMNQQFGVIEPKGKLAQGFWLKIAKLTNNINFAKFTYKKYVNPLRVYYTDRNIIYVNKKMHNYGTCGYPCYNCSSYFGFWIAFNLPSIIRAQDKKTVLKAILNGRREGKEKNVEPWRAKNAYM